MLPPALVPLLEEALDAADFTAFRRMLSHTELARRELQPLHRLAHAGQLLLDLDLEDLDRPPAVPEPLRGRLREVALPQQPGPEPVGLLASLRPTVALLLELVALRYRQHDIDQLLVAVHLLAEALPLLAWEDELGHAGDPQRLRRQVLVRGSLWGTAACPSGGPGARAARALRGASQDAGPWQAFLEGEWSNLGTHLTTCGSCPATCTVADRGSDELRARLALGATFRRSALVRLRHGATPGHAFAVPARDEVDRAWAASWDRLGQRVPGPLQSDGHPLPGLSALCSAVAGARVPTGTLVADVVAALQAAMRVGVPAAAVR